MIFVTVGSALPFDRLVKLIDDAVADGLITVPVFTQIGSGTYTPRHCKYVRVLSRSQYDSHFERATAVISHAGIGTITAALKARKSLLVMPRLPDFGELVDNHQLNTAKRFAALGHVLLFEDRSGLIANLARLADFTPEARHPNIEGVAVVIGRYLSELVAASRTGNSPARST